MTGKILSSIALMPKLKQADNHFLHIKKTIFVLFKVFNQRKAKSLKNRRTIRQKKSKILLPLIKVVEVKVEASPVKLEVNPKKIFIYTINIEANLSISQLLEIILPSSKKTK